MQPILSRLRNTFAIELRNLAWFRILLGLLVAWDLWGRYQLRFLVFGQPIGTPGPDVLREGLLPSSLSTQAWSPWNWSVFWLDRALAGAREALGSTDGDTVPDVWRNWETFLAGPEFAGVLILAGVVLALLYAAGLFTRLTNILLWIIVVSIQVRMPLLTTGADTLSRVFLFWTMWLPMGAAVSLDARFFSRQGFWRKRIHQTQTQLAEDQQQCPADKFSISSFATAALLIQFIAMYFFSGVAKCNEHWFSGAAIGEALSWDFYVRPQAAVIRDQAAVLTPLTYLVLATELALPFLVFFPGLFRWTRRPAAWLMIGMHLGIAALMTIGTFSAIAITGWVLFFGSAFPTTGNSWMWYDNRDTALQPRRILTDSPRPSATARDLMVGGLLVLVLWWNASPFLPTSSRWSFPAFLRPVIYQTGLHQDFPMFAQPTTDNWAWTHQATGDSGETIDVRATLPPPLHLPPRPQMLWAGHDQFLWRQLHVNLIFNQSSHPELVTTVRQRLAALERAYHEPPLDDSRLWQINTRTGQQVAW